MKNLFLVSLLACFGMLFISNSTSAFTVLTFDEDVWVDEVLVIPVPGHEDDPDAKVWPIVGVQGVTLEVVGVESAYGILPSGEMIGSFGVTLEVTPFGTDIYLPYYSTRVEECHRISLVDLVGTDFTIRTNGNTGTFITALPAVGGGAPGWRFIPEGHTITVGIWSDFMAPIDGSYRMEVDSIGFSLDMDYGNVVQIPVGAKTNYQYLDAVPEPMTGVSLAIGLGLISLRRRRDGAGR